MIQSRMVRRGKQSRFLIRIYICGDGNKDHCSIKCPNYRFKHCILFNNGLILNSYRDLPMRERRCIDGDDGPLDKLNTN